MSCAQAAQAAFDYGHSGNVFGDLVCYFKSITGSVSDAEILASASTDGRSRGGGQGACRL